MKQLISIINDANLYHYDKIRGILYLDGFPHTLQITFALHCAKDCYPLIDGAKYPNLKSAAGRCLELTEKYLTDNNSVSRKELKSASKAVRAESKTLVYNAAEAAYAAAYAANAAAVAAYEAAYAAQAAAAGADRAVAEAAYEAAYAAQAAAGAADAANVAGPAAKAAAERASDAAAKVAKLKEYYEYLINLTLEYYKLDKEVINTLYL